MTATAEKPRSRQAAKTPGEPIAPSAPKCFIARALVPLKAIAADPNQPRRSLDDDALAALADSIAQHGILQEIGVEWLGVRGRPVGDAECTAEQLDLDAHKLLPGDVRVIWGSRRIAAATKLNLPDVP